MNPTLPGYASLEFPPPPADRPYVVINMVSSTDGRTVIEGDEQGLGSDDDQRLMRELRVHADVVLNGANTLRVSGSSPAIDHEPLLAFRRARGRAEAPAGAILTASGDLPLGDEFFKAGWFRSIVFVAASASAARRAALEAAGAEVVVLPECEPLAWALRYLRTEIDARLLLVEGGATINGELVDRGLFDEFFLTLGPRIVGGCDPKTAVESDRAASLEGVTELELLSAIPNARTGELYLRYRRR